MASFLIEQRKEEEIKIPDLIIVPLCVLIQWKDEILRLDDKSDVFIYHGLNRFRDFKYLKKVPDFVIATYYSLGERELEKNNWNRIVLDEAHMIRNGIETKYKNIPKRAIGAYKISKKARFCHCITGTPFNNGLNDIKSLMKFIGYNGDITDFVKDFVIQKTKKDIIEPINVETILIKRPEKGLENYNKLLKNYMTILSKLKTKNNIIELRELHKKAMMLMMKLRLYCDIMQMNKMKEIVVKETETEEIYKEEEFTEDEKCDFYNTSIKIKTVYDKIEELLPIVPYKRIIVFSSFVTTINLLKTIIKNKMDDTIVLEYIGKKNSDERTKIVNTFTDINQTKQMVLLATIGAGSCGLNLTPCNTVILVDISINPFDQLQAINRVHRITQKNKVNVYKLCMKDMIEEKILKSHDKKIDQAKSTGIIMI
jgi:SNF2 family DNA or RNA helicase